jgi:hypothetical protein
LIRGEDSRAEFRAKDYRLDKINIRRTLKIVTEQKLRKPEQFITVPGFGVHRSNIDPINDRGAGGKRLLMAVDAGVVQELRPWQHENGAR